MGTKLIYSTEQIIQALKDTNGLISLAAKCLGCVPQTIYNRAARTQSIRQAIKNSRNELVDFAELALRSSVIAQESWAVQFTLKTLGKDRGYVERHELTGADGKAIKTETELKGIDYRNTITPLSPRSMDDSEASGEDKNLVDGQTVG